MQNGLSLAYQAYPAAPTNTNSTTRSNLLYLPPSSLNQYPVILNYWQNGSPASVRLTHQDVSQHAPNLVPNAYRGTNELQISSQQMVNLRMPQAPNQSYGRNQSPMLRPDIHFPRLSAHMGGLRDRIGHTNVLMNSQQANLIAAANRATLMALDPSRTLAAPTFSMNSGTSSNPLVGGNVTDPAYQNWRPAVLMHGALSGQAFTDALNKYIIRPSQQAAQHISDANSLLNKPPCYYNLSLLKEVRFIQKTKTIPSLGKTSNLWWKFGLHARWIDWDALYFHSTSGGCISCESNVYVSWDYFLH